MVKPEVGSSADSWGSKLNSNFDWLDQFLGAITTAGGTTAYTLTTSSGIAAYATGMAFRIKMNATNTGASTLNVDGLGAKNIVTSANAALAANDLVSGSYYTIAYDGTSFRVVGYVASQITLADATLAAFAALTTADDRMLDFAGADTMAVVTYATVLTNLAAASLANTNTYSAATLTFQANTSDASDTSAILLCGGGDSTTARGAFVIIGGNENGVFPGTIVLTAGSTGGIALQGATAITGALDATSVTGPPVAGAETTGTMTSGSANDHVIMTGNMTQAASGTFSARDSIVLDPGTSNRTLTRGSGMTMYVNGVNSASATIAANTLAVLTYRSGSVSILSGSGVS